MTEVKKRLEGVEEVDDVSLFGTRLHVRGREEKEKEKDKEKTGDFLESKLREALAGIVEAGDIRRVEPSLEDAFVLFSEAEEPEEKGAAA